MFFLFWGTKALVKTSPLGQLPKSKIKISETSYGSSVALRQRHGTYKVSLILRSAPPVGLREAPREERPDAFAVESKERGLQQSWHKHCCYLKLTSPKGGTGGFWKASLPLVPPSGALRTNEVCLSNVTCHVEHIWQRHVTIKRYAFRCPQRGTQHFVFWARGFK